MQVQVQVQVQVQITYKIYNMRYYCVALNVKRNTGVRVS